MTLTDYPHFEQRLRERWSLLRDEIHATLLRADAERYADIAGQVHDTKDLSLSHLLADVSHAEVLRDAEEVRDIEAALKRIDAGIYGICVRCHSAIGRRRLEAYPSAQRCLTCQKSHERTQTQSSRRH